MDFVIEHFHFIRPWWFLALIPALILALLVHRLKQKKGQWHSYLPPHLAHVLVVQGDQQSRNNLPIILSFIWLVTIFALAGPAWKKIERPLFKIKQANVVIIDMSLSMYATDISPDRLTRAKYKLTDLLKQLGEGETALIAFAGDAFVVSPMTSDIANLLNLLPSLNPSIMPDYGSRPDLAIESALALFKQAQYSAGQIYLIADDLSPAQAREIEQSLTHTNFELNIMAVGTQKGAPIKMPNDQLLKDHDGNIVLPQVPTLLLSNLAHKLSGRFVSLSHNQSDIKRLVAPQRIAQEHTQSTDQFGDRWQEFGPYLLLLLLPLVAFQCRKGIFSTLMVTLIVMTSTVPNTVYAAPNDQQTPPVTNIEQPTSDWWANLWQTADQQGLESYQQQNHQQALNQFSDPKWRGASQYQLGDYQQALESFEQFNDRDSLFNQGNALNQLGQHQEAINRYKQALALNDQSSQVTAQQIAQNTDIAKQLLAQQKQQQDQQSQQGDQQQNKDGESPQSEQDSEQQGDQQQNEQQSDQQSTDSESQQSSNSDDSEQAQQDGKQQQSQSADEENKDSAQQQSQDELSEEQKSEQQQRKAQAAKLNETFNKDNLTPEQLAHLNQLVNKVNDDPSLLLQNKMAVEARKRQRQRVVKKETKSW